MNNKCSLFIGALSSGLLSACCLFAPAPQSDWQTATTRLDMLVDRHYYLLESGFTCQAGMMSSEAVASWREHLIISKGVLLRSGSRCNDTIIPEGKVDDKLEVSADLARLRYQGKEYRYFATPPKLDANGDHHE